MSTSSALASFEPRDYRVVFVIQKSPAADDAGDLKFMNY